MRAKVILYGWALSILVLIAGLGTIEWAMETGEGSILLGMAMVTTFVVFCLQIAKYSAEVDAEAERFNKGFDKLIRRGIRGSVKIRYRAFRLRLRRDRRLCLEWESNENKVAAKA